MLGESIEPNEDATVWTIKVREGISFHDGTPLNADAVDRQHQPHVRRPPRLRRPQGHGQEPRRHASSRRSSTTTRSPSPPARTATSTSRCRGTCSRTSSTGQAGFIASPTWLAAVDADPTLATQPVGTGPFIVQEYLVGDRMRVDRNDNYWRTDEAGQPAAVPRRDRVPGHRRQPDPPAGAAVGRRRPDRHVRPQRGRAAEREPRRHHPAAERADRDRLPHVPPDPAGVPEQGGALRAEPGDRQAGLRQRDLRRLRPPVGPDVHAGSGRLPRARRERRVLPTTRPLPRRPSRPTRRPTAPWSINYSTTPTDDEPGAGRLPPAEVGRDRRRREHHDDRAVGADHQRPARLARLPGLRLAQPRRPVRRATELLVARLRLRRLRRRDGRRRGVAELRAPQRPGDQRPARPGPRRPRTTTSARSWPRRSTAGSPASAGPCR